MWGRCVLGVAFVGVAIGAGSAQGQEDVTPREIIERVDRLLRGDSSRGVARMEIVTEHWERQLTMEMVSLGTDHSLVRVRSPAREAGTATLMADDDIWNYLPKVDRTIKVPASMMGGAWMGSHFTNDDLVKESQLVEDYDIAITFDGVRDGLSVWEFRLTPKPDAAVVWGKIDVTVRAGDLQPTEQIYYDEDGIKVRQMTFADYRAVGGKVIPTRMKMVPIDEPGEYTEIVWKKIAFDVGIDKTFFTLQRLKAM